MRIHLLAETTANPVLTAVFEVSARASPWWWTCTP
jgi:hypothetical protein